jgi:hypothetical protein
MRKQLIELGLPCPPRGAARVAVPVVEEAAPSQEGLPSDDTAAADDNAVPEGESADDAEAVRDPTPKGTREEAQSREHQMTHLPKNHFCDVCSKDKIQRTQKRGKASTPAQDAEARQTPTKLGEQVTGDHFTKDVDDSVEEEGPNFHIGTVAVVLYDIATKWLTVYPQSTKTTYGTIAAMQHFASPKDKIASFYGDNAPELIAAATTLNWRLATSTTGMPQANGVAENCVRRTEECGECGIIHSGLNPQTF